jgi:hypothetical protein
MAQKQFGVFSLFGQGGSQMDYVTPKQLLAENAGPATARTQRSIPLRIFEQPGKQVLSRT